ncbi:MAG: alpha/beta hydrolase [Sphingomonadaceae bacterium]|nr:alpha/beta hydrolase [Sphingomonadaceae bacterium]
MHAIVSVPDPLSDWLHEAWAQEAEVRAVEVEGAMVRYRGWNLDSIDKPGLVLVHGYIAHARWWDHIAPRFTDRYRVIAPDFTGMGDSDRRPAYSRLQYAREILAAARHAGFKKAALVAHSFGSGCALHAALLAPDAIERVILIDGRVFSRDSSLEEAVERPETIYPSFAAARTRYRLMPPGDWPIPAVMDYVARHSIRRIDEDRWTWKFDPATVHAPRRNHVGPEIGGLTVPVDFIHAGNSDVIDEGDLATIVAGLPTCGAPVTIPLTHHHVMLEQPIALVATLNALLAHPRSA